MNQLQRELAAVADAHRKMHVVLADLSDDVARRPSLLPGWSVGHVLTHMARNAEGLVRMVNAAAEGHIGEMYPGGLDRRAADIDAGAGRSAAELVIDVEEQSRRLEAAFTELDDRGWSGHGRTVQGEVAMTDLPTMRRREVLVHLADLGLGYTLHDWPADFVRFEVNRLSMVWASRQPMGMTELPAAALAAAPAVRAAWLLGRVAIDGLAPAGVMG